MKFLSLWVFMLALVAFNGCSAKEPTDAGGADPQLENNAVINENAANTRIAQATPKPPSQTQSRFKQGVHYQQLTPVQPTSTSPDKIEVAEAFMYGCPHCFSFEPFLQKWTPNKPENVNVVRIPVAFNRQAIVHARVYFTAEALGIIDKTHLPFFREIHVNRRPMTSTEELVEFFADYGVDETTFEKTFRSFEVEHKLRVANTMAERYRISSVPTIVVNGKYTSSGSPLAGDQLVSLIDHLIDQETDR